MAILNLKAVPQLDNEADVEAGVAVENVEKGQGVLKITVHFKGTKTKRPLVKPKLLTIAADGVTMTNAAGDVVNAKPPENAESRKVDFELLIQEWIQSARDCGEIPEFITIEL